MESAIGIKGEFVIRVWDKDGNVKRLYDRVRDTWGEELRVDNLITNAGLAVFSSRINGSGGLAAFTYLAVGTSSTAAAAGDTALLAEITDSGLARASATASQTTTTITNDTATLIKTFSVTGSKAITEAGFFNASSGVTLGGRQVFSAVNVNNGDTFALTYNIKCS